MTFPPGRGDAGDQPGRHGVADDAMTMGIVVVAAWRPESPAPLRDDDVDLQANQLCREVGEPLVLPFGPALLDGDVLPLDVAEVVQTLPECLHEVGVPAGEAPPSKPIR